MLSQGRLKPRIQATHSSNETVGRCKVELTANLSIESIMEKNIPLRGIRKHPLPGWQPGFTLIELIITLAIAGILLAVAVPNFISFVQNSRLTSQANDLVTALNYARSEAIKRGVRVTVCSRASDTSCAAAGVTDWSNGWLVFVNPDNDAVIDAGELPPLLVRQPLESGNTMNTAGLQRVTYQNTGFSGNMDTFRLCDVRGMASGRAIAVSLQGRVSTTVGTTSCP